jgi:hypothetical protein
MVQGRVTVDREHFMTSHPIRRRSGDVLTDLVMAVLGRTGGGLSPGVGHPGAAIPAGHSHRQCHYRYHRLSVYGRVG